MYFLQFLNYGFDNYTYLYTISLAIQKHIYLCYEKMINEPNIFLKVNGQFSKEK